MDAKAVALSLGIDPDNLSLVPQLDLLKPTKDNHMHRSQPIE
jgi:hypothetical protein